MVIKNKIIHTKVDQRQFNCFSSINHFLVNEKFSCIIGQMGYCIAGQFNIHIWAWSASPSVQVGRL